jgi:hypothetical protein
MLRVALLTMLEPAEGISGTPRAFLRVGGSTVAQQQLALVLALKCERVVCLARAMRPELIALQHAVEGAGAKFHLVPGPRALLGLVTAADELIVLADGLFASAPQAAALLEQGQAVLVQPVVHGLAAGFERIDVNHAAAGAMRIPGRLVEQIAELPGEYDAASALQRIALQAGVRQRQITPDQGKQAFWALVQSDDQAHALEPQWISQRIRDDGPIGPSRAVALSIVRQFGAALLHARSGAAHVAIGAVLLALIGLGVGWLGLVPLGLGLCAGGWILRQCAALLARIEGDPAGTGKALRSDLIYGLMLDVVLVTLAGWGTQPEPFRHIGDRFFAPFMLVALLRIVPRSMDRRWARWLDDRALLALGLAAALGLGAGGDAIRIGAVLAALGGIALSGLSTRLTRL